MPYTDHRYHRSRASSWTKRDQQREDAARRRGERNRLKEQQHRATKLDAMPTGEREAFLRDERAEQEALALKAQQQEEAHRAAELERKESMKESARLTVGYLHSEFAAAVARRERYELQQGDWLEDPVEVYLTSRGFAEEYETSAGVRLQIHLCLDCSNSMRSNSLESIAKETLWTMYLMLRQVERGLPQDTLQVQVWLWAKGERGDQVRNPTSPGWFEKDEEGVPAPDADGLDSQVMESIRREPMSGEDTRIEPLLRKLQIWDETHGDPGAYRLDIILTDGVLEHPKDIRQAGQVQYGRDGNLQTVILNFMPVEEWGEYPVPEHCVQYPADPTNVMALMRMAVGDWVNGL